MPSAEFAHKHKCSASDHEFICYEDCGMLYDAPKTEWLCPAHGIDEWEDDDGR